MTYHYKEVTLPMTRIQNALKDHHRRGASYQALARLCSTTPKTISNWIQNGPDLKWYSLVDVCLGLDLTLKDVFEGTRWEKLL